MNAVATLAAAFSLGAIAWTFLVQAPLLTRRLGRDRFVPLQMGLVWPLVAIAGVASVTMLALVTDEHHRILAAVALGLTVIAGVTTPSALKAGGASLRSSLETSEAHSASRFLVDGGGAASRLPHRVLGVAFLGVVATQGLWLALSSDDSKVHAHDVAISEAATAHSGGHQHHAATTSGSAERPLATAETARAIVELRASVEHALASATTNGKDVAAPLQRQYAAIFEGCTMTGHAHEVLHDFLTPIGTHLGRLDSAPDPETTRTELAEIAAQLGTFEERFVTE